MTSWQCIGYVARTGGECAADVKKLIGKNQEAVDTLYAKVRRLARQSAKAKLLMTPINGKAEDKAEVDAACRTFQLRMGSSDLVQLGIDKGPTGLMCPSPLPQPLSPCETEVLAFMADQYPFLTSEMATLRTQQKTLRLMEHNIMKMNCIKSAHNMVDIIKSSGKTCAAGEFIKKMQLDSDDQPRWTGVHDRMDDPKWLGIAEAMMDNYIEEHTVKHEPAFWEKLEHPFAEIAKNLPGRSMCPVQCLRELKTHVASPVPAVPAQLMDGAPAVASFPPSPAGSSALTSPTRASSSDNLGESLPAGRKNFVSVKGEFHEQTGSVAHKEHEHEEHEHGCVAPDLEELPRETSSASEKLFHPPAASSKASSNNDCDSATIAQDLEERPDTSAHKEHEHEEHKHRCVAPDSEELPGETSSASENLLDLPAASSKECSSNDSNSGTILQDLDENVDKVVCRGHSQGHEQKHVVPNSEEPRRNTAAIDNSALSPAALPNWIRDPTCAQSPRHSKQILKSEFQTKFLSMRGLSPVGTD